VDGGNFVDEGEEEWGWGSDPAEADAAMEILRVLVGAWPVSLYQFTGLGYLPLHLACCHNAPLQEVWYLVEESTPAVRATDACGVLPLHLASGSYRPDPLPASSFLLNTTRTGPSCRPYRGDPSSSHSIWLTSMSSTRCHTHSASGRLESDQRVHRENGAGPMQRGAGGISHSGCYGRV
jgi:hypothetical protein